MRKKKEGRKFHRETGQRKALLKGLAREFFLKERIQTTEAKAKELRMFVEKFITQARKGDLSCRRNLAKYFSKTTVKKLVDELAPKYKTRQGGYTRIVKLGPRKSDGAKIAIIELVK